jgi:hypothetical protein
MNKKSLLMWLLAATIPWAASAQDVIKLNMSDVYFQWRPMPKGSAMCGYSILGNHLGRDDPKVEWDVNIDELVQGEVHVVGVSAGTFTVSGKTRTPRAPITELSFTTADDPEPLAVEWVGAPNVDNGVRGTIPLAPAAKLFTAISSTRQVELTIKYSDGTTERLSFAGFRDVGKFSGEKNGPFARCLNGYTPKIVNPHPAP